jgi:Zn-dependent peptidase ImmA (M78 family)
MDTYLLLSVFAAIGTSLYLFIDITKEAYSAICWYFLRKTVTDQVVNEVIHFSKDILLQKGVETLPSYVLSQEPSKYMGSFDGSLIIVYVNNQSSLRDLVETSLHEIAHYLQKHTNANEFDKYDDYARELGYRKNPLELEAQRFARLWRRSCVEYLYAKGVIPGSLL